MRKLIVYSNQSITSLKEISHFIAKDSKTSARIFVLELYDVVVRLSYFPNLGEKIELNFRRFIFSKNYKILYEVKKETILILDVVNVRKNCT